MALDSFQKLSEKGLEKINLLQRKGSLAAEFDRQALTKISTCNRTRMGRRVTHPYSSTAGLLRYEYK